MGKADKMDVTGEMSSHVEVDNSCSNSMTFLLPFLLFAHCFQLYNAYALIAQYALFQLVEWQVIACGVLFFALGVGNLSTTLFTYFHKYKSA